MKVSNSVNYDRIAGLGREAFSLTLSIWADQVLTFHDSMLLKYTMKLLTKLRGTTPMYQSNELESFVEHYRLLFSFPFPFFHHPPQFAVGVPSESIYNGLNFVLGLGMYLEIIIT